MTDYLYTDTLESELIELEAEAAEIEDIEDEDEKEEAEQEFDRDRFNALTELFEEIGTGLGASMIPEDEIADYARSYAEDISGADLDGWPFSNIDWDDAADELMQDYTMVTFDGTDYYYQA